jgi:Putative prokaryotic signal transducing protein
VACGSLRHNAQLAATQELPTPMVELLRTNDIVLIGFLQSLFENANIPVLVADSHISALEGSIGAFPRRILVPEDRVRQARRLMIEAGLEAELRRG